MTNGKRVVSNSILFVFLLFLTKTAFSQKNEVKVYGISGQAFINELLTPKQAKETALEDAKFNALRKAGIGEYIKSNSTLLSSTVGSKYDGYTNTEQLSQLEGSILDYVITKDTQYINAEKLLVVGVTINATIIKYEKKPDINFDVRLFGVKSVYNNNDKLTFSVSPSMDAYLNVFTWFDQEVTHLYPSGTEKQTTLKSETTYLFPLSNKFDYVLTTEKKENEKGRIIFVFTKSPIKFVQKDAMGNVKLDDIFTWINSISLDQRKVFNMPVLIQH